MGPHVRISKINRLARISALIIAVAAVSTAMGPASRADEPPAVGQEVAQPLVHVVAEPASHADAPGGQRGPIVAAPGPEPAPAPEDHDPVDLRQPYTYKCVLHRLQDVTSLGETYIDQRPSASAVMKTVRNMRNGLTNWLSGVFRLNDPVAVLDAGTNIKADYLARSSLGIADRRGAGLSTAEIENEFNAEIQSVVSYKQNLDQMLDQEITYRLQISTVEAALKKIGDENIKPPYRVELPVVKTVGNNRVANDALTLNYNSRAELSNALKKMQKDLNAVTSSDYSKEGNFRNLALTQKVNIENLKAIRRYIDNVIAVAKVNNPNLQVPENLTSLLTRINGILNPENALRQKVYVPDPANPGNYINYTANDLSPPPMAIQKFDWQEFRKTATASKFFAGTPGSSTLGRVGNGIANIGRKLTGRPTIKSDIQNTYQSLVNAYKSLTPQEKTALGLDRPTAYLSIWQTTKWGAILGTPLSLYFNQWLGITAGNAKFNFLSYLQQVYFSTDKKQEQVCAAYLNNDAAYENCATTFVEGKLLRQYMNTIDASSTGFQPVYNQNEIIVDPSKLSTTATPIRGVQPMLLRSSNNSNLVVMSGKVAPILPTGNGLSSNLQTGSLQVDLTQVPADGNGVVIGKRSDGKLVLHVDRLMASGTAGIFDFNPKTGQMTIDPLALKYLQQISIYHMQDEQAANSQTVVKNTLNSKLLGYDPSSVTGGMSNWDIPQANAATFNYGLTAYFDLTEGPLSPVLQPALDKIEATTNVQQQQQVVSALAQQVPLTVAQQVCTALSRHEPTFRCPINMPTPAPSASPSKGPTGDGDGGGDDSGKPVVSGDPIVAGAPVVLGSGIMGPGEVGAQGGGVVVGN